MEGTPQIVTDPPKIVDFLAQPWSNLERQWDFQYKKKCAKKYHHCRWCGKLLLRSNDGVKVFSPTNNSWEAFCRDNDGKCKDEFLKTVPTHRVVSLRLKVANNAKPAPSLPLAEDVATATSHLKARTNYSSADLQPPELSAAHDIIPKSVSGELEMTPALEVAIKEYQRSLDVWMHFVADSKFTGGARPKPKAKSKTFEQRKAAAKHLMDESYNTLHLLLENQPLLKDKCSVVTKRVGEDQVDELDRPMVPEPTPRLTGWERGEVEHTPPRKTGRSDFDRNERPTRYADNNRLG